MPRNFSSFRLEDIMGADRGPASPTRAYSSFQPEEGPDRYQTAGQPPGAAPVPVPKPDAGPSKAPTASDWWLDPKNKYDHVDFFDKHYRAAVDVANRLGVDPTLLQGLAAHESTWGADTAGKNNFFGMTPKGDRSKGIDVPGNSIEGAWSYWESKYGSRVVNVGSDAQRFIDNLEVDNREATGPDKMGKYNPENVDEGGDPEWRKKMAGAIKAVRTRLPRWKGNLDSLP